MAANGNVLDVAVVMGSGSPLLDNAAQEMLRGAKMPAREPNSPVPCGCDISLKISSRRRRPELLAAGAAAEPSVTLDGALSPLRNSRRAQATHRLQLAPPETTLPRTSLGGRVAPSGQSALIVELPRTMAG